MKHTEAQLKTARAAKDKAKGGRSDTAVLIKHLIKKGVLVKSELPAKLKKLA